MIYRIKNGKNEKALKIILPERMPKEPDITERFNFLNLQINSQDP
jgi:hypothetical protein